MSKSVSSFKFKPVYEMLGLTMTKQDRYCFTALRLTVLCYRSIRVVETADPVLKSGSPNPFLFTSTAILWIYVMSAYIPSYPCFMYSLIRAMITKRAYEVRRRLWDGTMQTIKSLISPPKLKKNNQNNPSNFFIKSPGHLNPNTAFKELEPHYQISNLKNQVSIPKHALLCLRHSARC